MKRRRNVLAQVKGFRYGRGSKEAQAREALFHAGNHAFAHRRDKKNNMRRLWTVRMNAALRTLGLTYSRFIDALHKKNIGLDRKTLATIAEHQPEVFETITKSI